MKKLKITFISVFILLLTACNSDKNTDTIKFLTSAEYPNFEYYENGVIKGFDIDLARLIAKKLNKKASFENVPFSATLPALQNGFADAVISTVSITKERQQNFDFSDSYYKESLAVVYPKTSPITDPLHLSKKKVACQLGTTMAIWLKDHVPDAEVSAVDNNNQAIEALKANQVQAVLIDAAQAEAFSRKNPQLSFTVIAQSDAEYGIVLKKGSPLTQEINAALKTLKQDGELDALKKKWFGSPVWKN